MKVNQPSIANKPKFVLKDKKAKLFLNNLNNNININNKNKINPINKNNRININNNKIQRNITNENWQKRNKINLITKNNNSNNNNNYIPKIKITVEDNKNNSPERPKSKKVVFPKIIPSNNQNNNQIKIMLKNKNDFNFNNIKKMKKKLTEIKQTIILIKILTKKIIMQSKICELFQRL